MYKGELTAAFTEQLHCTQARERSGREVADAQAKLEQLLQRNRTAGSGAEAQMRSARAALPAAKQRSEVLAAVGAHRAVVIAGATGCGKSTQVRL